MNDINRRDSLKYICYSIALAESFPFFIPSSAKAGDLELRLKAKNTADSFLETTENMSFEDINSAKLLYHVLIKGVIDMNLIATMSLKKDKNKCKDKGTYHLELDLATKGVLDDVKLFFGLFVSSKARELSKSLETKFTEDGIIEGQRFRVKSLVQTIRDGKPYVTAKFDENGEIKLYRENEKKPCDIASSGIYGGALGKGFWKFILFDSPNTQEIKKHIVNPYEDYELKLQTTAIRCDNSSNPDKLGKYKYTDNKIFFEQGQLSIIKGNPCFRLAYSINSNSNLKVPFWIMLPKVISSDRKKEKEKKLRQLEKDRPHMSSNEYDIKFEEIKKINTVAAEKVNVYLIDYSLN